MWGYGHCAKSCRSPIRCFICGGIGHKKFSCLRFQKRMQKSSDPRDLVKGIDDDSWILQLDQVPKPDLVMDSMLLDLDVVGCSTPYRNMSVDPDCNSSSVMISNICEAYGLVAADSTFVPVEGSDPKDISCFPRPSPGSSEDESLGQMQLGLATPAKDPGDRFDRIQNIDCNKVYEDWCAQKFSVLVSTNLFDKGGFGEFLYRLVVSSVTDLTVVDHPADARPRINLADIRIIDPLRYACSLQGSGDSNAEITFYIKPCKFFLYCFLAAHRHQAALIPPVGSWKVQLFSKHSSFVSSSPDSAEVDKCIFGKEKVFSSKSVDARCRKKLVYPDKTRRSPRLSRRY